MAFNTDFTKRDLVLNDLIRWFYEDMNYKVPGIGQLDRVRSEFKIMLSFYFILTCIYIYICYYVSKIIIILAPQSTRH